MLVFILIVMSTFLRIANEVSKEFTDIGFHNGVIASGDIFCTSDKMSQKN